MQKKNKWKEYLAELLVVIVGITIAFALENYSKEKKDKDEQTLYLNAISADLNKDIAHIESLIDSSKVLMQHVTEVFQFNYTQAATEQFKRHHITSTYTVPYFKSNNGSYLSLINSGDMKIIESFELRNAITDLYTVWYTEIERMDAFIQNLVNEMIYPYMLDNIAFEGRRDGIRDASPLRNNKAMNLLGSYYNFLDQRIKECERVLVKCREVQELLNEDS